MSLLAFANNAAGQVAEDIDAADTTIFLKPGQGSRFPALSPGYYFIGTLVDKTGVLNEIVHVTAISGDQLTVVRGQEDTLAQSWPTGTAFKNLWTKGSVEAFVQVDQLLRATGYVKAEVDGDQPYYSPPCSSPETWDIESITMGAGNTIVVKTRNPNGLVAGDQVFIRAGGFDGQTTRAHRANNWEGGPFVNPVTLQPDLAGVQLGGNSWGVTPLDTKSFTLDFSVWKVSPFDLDPVFLYGTAYKTLVDATPFVDKAMQYIGQRDGTLTFVGRFFALLTPPPLQGPDNLPQWRPGSDFTVQGNGKTQTIIYRGDYINETPWRFTGSNVVARDICQDGNRRFNAEGRHGWFFDGLTFGGAMSRCRMERVWTRGMSGYGTADGVNCNKYFFEFDGCEWTEVNISGISVKGQSINWPDDNYTASSVTNNKFGFWSMGTIGTNKAVPIPITDPLVPVTVNPVVTNTTNPKQIQVHLPVFCYNGQRVQLKGLTPTGGITFGDNWFTVIFGSKFATLDVGTQTVTSTVAAGGGSAGMMLSPMFRNQASAIEGRGPGWVYMGIQLRGWMGRHSGVSFLGGNGSNANGAGGHFSVLTGYTTKDTTPPGLSYNAARHLNMTAMGNVVEAATLTGNGSGIGVQTGGTTSQVSVNVRMTNMGNIATINADNSMFKFQATNCAAGWWADGGQSTAIQNLPDNPFTVEEGSMICTVHAPGSTGIAQGVTITIAGADTDPTGTIDMNQSFDVVQVLDANNFTVQLSVFAPDDAVFGGTESYMILNSSQHFVSGVIVESDMRGMLAGIGVEIRQHVNDLTTRMSHYDGTGTPFTNTFNRPVTWGPGNTGLPNV